MSFLENIHCSEYTDYEGLCKIDFHTRKLSALNIFISGSFTLKCSQKILLPHFQYLEKVE